jgi:hypothetical protein
MPRAPVQQQGRTPPCGPQRPIRRRADAARRRGRQDDGRSDAVQDMSEVAGTTSCDPDRGQMPQPKQESRATARDSLRLSPHRSHSHSHSHSRSHSPRPFHSPFHSPRQSRCESGCRRGRSSPSPRACCGSGSARNPRPCMAPSPAAPQPLRAGRTPATAMWPDGKCHLRDFHFVRESRHGQNDETGAGEGIRTLDPYLGKVMLYP